MVGKHTPGPWGWFGNDHGIYLATEHSGRRYVMAFARMGMQRAQPRFQSSGVMVDGVDLLAFEVGDKNVRGLKAAKADPSVYRYDISGIDHPDARLIAAAPEMLEALKAVLDAYGGGYTGEINEAREVARAAIAKAEGE